MFSEKEHSSCKNQVVTVFVIASMLQALKSHIFPTTTGELFGDRNTGNDCRDLYAWKLVGQTFVIPEMYLYLFNLHFG